MFKTDLKLQPQQRLYCMHSSPNVAILPSYFFTISFCMSNNKITVRPYKNNNNNPLPDTHIDPYSDCYMAYKCRLLVFLGDPTSIEKFQRCCNDIKIQHVVAITEYLWMSFPQSHTGRQGLTWQPDCVQAELNQGGGWERLCMERDPFVLTGLMWAWLEQLKEPVISVQEAKTLNPDNSDAQTVLNTLDQVSAHSLLIHISKTTARLQWIIYCLYCSKTLYTTILPSFWSLSRPLKKH